MKKVGVVTFYSIYNYGSVLQAYALVSTIEKLEYDCVLINYQNMKLFHNIIMKYTIYGKRAITIFRHPSLFLRFLKGKIVGRASITSRSDELKEKFDDFVKSNFDISDDNYLKPKKSGFGAFVCGSDQIWQIHAAGLHELFFLRFAPENMRISYAPSFGGITIPQYNQKRLKRYLEEIPYLTVREDSAVNLVMQSIGRPVQQVLDPVLLVGKKFWEQKISENEIDKNEFMICYFLSEAFHAYDVIERISDMYGLKILWITSGKPLKDKDYKQYDADPLEFVSLINNAKFVCTDSLHGTEFSILMNTPFYVFERNYEVEPEQSTRIDSLLRMVHLEERLVKKRDKRDILRNAFNVKFDNVIEVLDVKRKESIEYIRKALKECLSR